MKQRRHLKLHQDDKTQQGAASRSESSVEHLPKLLGYSTAPVLYSH